ncbi:MAG: hypothetical protein ACFFB6_02745, partial [Promethearchaeota archaeon]
SSPTGLSASPSSWTNIDDFDLSWNNPGDTSGIAGAYYKLDSAPGSPTDGTYVAGSDIETITGIVVGSDGTHTVYVWLRDAAGNVDHTTYVTVQVYLDTTDPSSPTGLSASPPSWTNIDDFDLSWNNPADLSGIVGVYYKLDTTPSTPTDGTYVPGADIESLTGITVGTDGIHTIYVWLVDDAGNVDHMNYASTLLYLDITNPSVISISSTTSNGTYGLNVEIYITITFSEPVYVTGTTPTLTLETNSIPDGIAYYTSGNGTDTLTFTYTVGLGHSSSDLDYVSMNALSGTIKDIVGNDADPTLPSPGALGSLGYNKDIIIETTPPVIINVSSSISNGTYGIGEVIDIIVYFSEPVSVTGTPQLTLETGLIDAVIDYVGGSGTDALIFGYVVASGHASSDLGYVSIDALSGIIKDIAGNDANMTLPAPGASGSLSANKDIIIETIQPDITSVSSTKPDGTYGEGETINIVITFSEVVYVTGIPQLTLETGSIDAVINYVSGSGTDTLIFSYTVASGHNSDDLEYISTDALSLNGGTIKDSVGNDAILTLPAPGTSGSLSFNKDIIISTYVPQDNFGLIMTIVIGSSAGVAIVAVITILLVKRRRKKW